MSPGANVLSIQALEDFRTALSRFGGEAQDALRSAELEIRRTLEWLVEAQRRWQREVAKRRETERRAAAALSRCQASGYRDRDGYYHPPDCSAYEQALSTARFRRAEAEKQLRNAQQWEKVARDAVDSYHREARRFQNALSSELPNGTALLERKIGQLRAYLAVIVGAMSAGAAGAGVASPGAGGASVGASVDRLVDAMNRLSGTKSGRAIVQTILERGTQIRFGETQGDAIAQFDRGRNEIVINEGLKDASPNVIAAHLAHEGTHAQWNRTDSIDQEYHAFKAEAEVWDELKGDEHDKQCDWVSGMIALGEKRAKEIIRRYYPNLPERA